MNYGLWTENVSTLEEANTQLVNFVFHKSELSNQSNLNILDIGCGYGEQDMVWLKQMDATNRITAVDISEEQIYSAMKKNSTIQFDLCDAAYIGLKYRNQTYDRIISLESAFHYPERSVFFKQVNHLLKENGKFIITDIMLNPCYNTNGITNILLYIFADVLCIPVKNLITEEEWDKQISSELNIKESMNLSDKTFQPYYTYFMKHYCKHHNYPDWVGHALSDFFCTYQPFLYKIAICTKK
jgi:cyclopropane fatty-acyl-phospholipid synthase-like methyltransferase